MPRCLSLVLALVLLGLACFRESAEESSGTESAYVGSATCAECHTSEFEKWRGSHHDLAMQEVSSQSVLGDFDDTLFEHFGVTTRFFQDDGRFLVNTQGTDGEYRDFEIAYVFGVEPLQQYLIEFPGGRLQCLTTAWDVGRERWFSLYPEEGHAPDDPFHWTGLYQRWNAMCADCHSTNLVKGYDAEQDRYETTWSEIDVACEACHGPGNAHVEWARAPEHGKPEYSDDSRLTVALGRGAARAQLDTCAPCHSRRTPLASPHEPGRNLLDGYLPERLHQGYYHADGQILDEVYVYGSFVQSKMHTQGVTCTDCHDPHSLDLVLEDNALCMQCHSLLAPLDRFPTLQKKDYDSPSHHFHAAGSEGSLCVSCHMPATNYMVVDPRRDHSFRIPRPDLSVELSIPNACSGCHADQSAQWAAETVARWYPRELGHEPHFATSFARARSGDRSVQGNLQTIVEDADAPPIVRATALELLSALGASLPAALRALGEEDALLRYTAARSLDALPLERRMPLTEFLNDPVLAVRMEAGRLLAQLPIEALPIEQRESLTSALTEYEEAQAVSADMPWSHLNLAILHEVRREPVRAVASYRKALALDPGFLPARFNLSTLYNRLQRNAEALQVLQQGTSIVPEDGELRYSMGLLLAEMGRGGEAADSLLQAARLMPQRPRVHYNAGLALRQAQRLDEAEGELRAACILAPQDPEILHALALLYIERADWELARSYAERLTAILPEADWTAQLIQRIDAEAGNR